MKWQCPICGHEQPAHVRTTRAEMPLCSQLTSHRGINLITMTGYYTRTPHGTPVHANEFRTPVFERQFLNAGACGGLPVKVDICPPSAKNDTKLGQTTGRVNAQEGTATASQPPAAPTVADQSASLS